MNRYLFHCSIASFAICLCTSFANSADIQVGVSSNDAYVGFPITLQVRIDNASKHTPPEIDPVDGLKFESMGPPSTNRSVTSINGRVTSRTSSTYRWLVTPNREGTFTIPPIRVNADGISSITKVVRITATKSDAGDLLIAEVESNQDKVYVGEPIELSLKIYVKAYVDKEANIKLSDGNMWSLLSDQTQWGVFSDAIEQMTMNRMQPRGIEVIRKDDDGKDALYYRYQIDTTLFPSRPGPVDLDGVKIGFDYPIEIGQSNSRRGGMSSFESMLGDDFPFPGSMFGDSFFGGPRLTRRITKSQPLMVEPELDSVTANEIPTENQPEDFAGAVGRYVIDTQAADTNVQAGDPIQLSIRVRGTGKMETVAAPPLSVIDELTNKFKVDDQPLAGRVNRDQKLFTTTIRPIDETVTEIPAIPFTYFDPDSGEYETSYSDPIPINVTAAEVLKLDRAPRDASVTEKPIRSETIAGDSKPQTTLNLSWQDVTLSKDKMAVSLQNVVLPSLLFPPLVFLVSLLMRGFVAANRRTASESKTLAKIKSADDASEMSKAMIGYFAKRWKIPTLGNADHDPSADRVLGHLRSAGLHRYAVRVEKWMDSANRSHLATEAELETLRQSAMDLVRDAKSQRNLPVRKSIAGVAILVAMLVTNSSVLAEQPLITIQQAEKAYRDGEFAAASSLLNSIDTDHPANTERLINIGNAWWQIGEKARSKASYLRALSIDPTNDTARKNLLAINDTNRLIQKLMAAPMRPLLIVAIVSWSMLWLVLSIRLWTNAFPWRGMAIFCLLTALLTGTLVALQFSQVWFPHHAVIVADEIQLRTGDGETFDIVQTIPNASGKIVRWKAERPGWVHVIADDGAEGWLPENATEIIRR